MNAKDIKEKYILWRPDPSNIRFDDSVFCSENSISIKQLDALKDSDPDIMRRIVSRTPTDEEFFGMLNQLLQLCYSKALNGGIPVKSLEGLITGITSLLKQRQLSTGKPTEIVQYDELKKKTPQERYDMLMGYLRRADDRGVNSN